MDQDEARSAGDSSANCRCYVDDLSKLADTLGKKHIRLLELQPCVYGTEVTARLVPCALDNCRPYYALSYSWGAHIYDAAIYLESQKFQVTRHLEQALQRIRHVTKIVYLWVDMVCINQLNFAERSQQVGMMADLYRRAERVLIWLGESGRADDSEPFAFDQHSHNLLMSAGDEAWWRRLWIVQECSVPQACPMIQFGPHRMDWSTFLHEWEVYAFQKDPSIDRLMRDTPSSQMPYYYLRVLLERRQYSNSQPDDARVARDYEREPLFHQMLDTSTQVCSDPHDKVYAVLSLAFKDEQAKLTKFTTDYNIPLEQLYAQVTAQFLVDGPLLATSTLFDNWHLGIPPLASWSFDFRRRRNNDISEDLGNVLGRHWRQKACAHNIPAPDLHAESRTLDMRVVMLGRIVSVLPLSELLGEDASDGWLNILSTFSQYEAATHVTDQAAHNQSLRRLRQTSWSLILNLFIEYRMYVSGDLDLAAAQLERYTGEHLEGPIFKAAMSRYHNALLALEPREQETSLFNMLKLFALIATTDGLLALVPSSRAYESEDLPYRVAREGDAVALPVGTNIPLVLRQDGRSDGIEAYTLVNGCFMPAVQDGRACHLHEYGSELARWVSLK